MKLIFNFKNINKTKEAEINSIIYIKQQHWSFTFNEQKLWWEKFSNIDDELLYINNKEKIISFLRLRNSNVLIDNDQKNMKCITEVCVDKKFLKKGLGKKMINKVIEILKKKKISGFLLCYNQQREFYNKCNLFYFKNVFIKKINSSVERKLEKKKFLYLLNLKKEPKKITLLNEIF